MVLAVAVVLVPTAAARGSEPFEATIVPDGPVLLEAHLRTVPTYDFLANVSVPRIASPAQLLVLAADELVVNEYEVSARGVRDRDRAFLPGEEEKSGQSYTRVLVFLEASRPQARWELLTRGVAPAELALGGKGACELTRSPPTSSPFHGVAVEERPSGTDPGDWLELSCVGTPVNLTGDHALYVTDARIRIEYDNGTHPEGEPRRSSRTIETGSYTVQDPLGRTRHLSRVARLVTPDPEAAFMLSGAGEVRVQAPRLLTVGQVALPTGNGSVQWGASRWPGPVLDAMRADGAFLFAPGGPREITVDGQAFRPEFVTERGPIAVLDEPKDWGVVVAGLGLLALFLTRPWVYLVPLFTRLTQDRALDHERRRAILDTVQMNPGLRVQDAAKLLRFHWSVVNYHVKVLARQGLLQRRRAGRETLLYVGHDLNPSKMEELRRLRHPTVQSLLEAIERNPTQTQAELAQKIGVRQPRISRLITDLERLGVIRCERDGRGWTYRRVNGHAGPAPASGPAGIATPATGA